MNLLAIVVFIVCCAILGRTLGPFATCVWKRYGRSRRLRERLSWYSMFRDRPASFTRLAPGQVWIYGMRHPERRVAIDRALYGERGATTLETVLVVLLIIFLVLLILRVA